MGSRIDGPATAVLRAPIPLETSLTLACDEGRVRLLSAQGDLIAEARPAGEDPLATPPSPPSYSQARAAGARFLGLTQTFHPICFTCSPRLDENLGLRVFVGQTEGQPEGHVSGAWTPLSAFVDAEGRVTPEALWAALDCPGSVAWAAVQGGGGVLGTMTCEIRRRPWVNEACMITAWPIEQSGRKRISGTALFTADGELLARSQQIWIGRPPAS